MNKTDEFLLLALTSELYIRVVVVMGDSCDTGKI